ncbi:GNAT family N-acetyltransferase [Desulfogranum mediterraneum]|uniref:GNAT family N-acetyltransferase n=1 Tax=Desulfogranum mediterraneum TaxID=160661 RepID=UPI0004144E1B|nr:GNAT family N-acetyltransferase [Desulfogranum mediterraneum]
MKIRRLTPAEHPKALALLKKAFPGSSHENRLFTNLHQQSRVLDEWICIHRHRAIAYIAYSRAYRQEEICGLHLALVAVAPELQNQGIGSELIRFSLRQPEIEAQPLYVLGAAGFYQKFGFEPCSTPLSPFATNKRRLLTIRNPDSQAFQLGYEPEFTLASRPRPRSGQQRRG